MIARKNLPEKFRKWNEKWGAPWGFTYPILAKVIATKSILDSTNNLPVAGQSSLFKNLRGYFSTQTNNSTRIYEYPWAFEAGRPKNGQRSLDIGGGFGGFQFVLSKTGLQVSNIDPGDKGHSWLYTKTEFDRLNAAYGTNVKLIQTTIDKAEIPDASIDSMYCISVIEHLEDADRKILLQNAKRVLKMGGILVLTVDLFLDLIPFSDRSNNKWGMNIKISDIVKESRMRLVVGNKDELYGYPEFMPKKILSKLGEYLIGTGYPALSQMFVLKKI